MKVIASALVIIVMAVFWTILTVDTPYEQPDGIGNVMVVVVAEDGSIIIEDRLSFKEGDTLLGVLDQNYTLRYTTTSIGRILLDFESVKTDFERDFIQIRISGQLLRSGAEPLLMDNDLSPVGIDSIPLVDGNRYYFVYQRIGH